MRTHKEFGPRLCEVETTDGKVLVPVTVKRSRGLRYIRVTVNESMEVTLKIPWQVSEKVAMEFFQSQGNWVGRMLKNKPRRLSLLEYLQKSPGYRSTAGKSNSCANLPGGRLELIATTQAEKCV